MIVDVEDFEIKILEMIAITNQNIKKENDYLLRLKKGCCKYWNVGDTENPNLIIPKVETKIKCLEAQVRTFETALSLAKSVAY